MPNLEWEQEVERTYQRRKPPQFCSIAGCGRPLIARGWCHRHYDRWKNYGDPLAGRDVERTARDGKPLPCIRCGADKPIGRKLCDVCRERSREARRDYERRNARAKHLKSKYGITYEMYVALLATQGGVCGICQGPPTKGFRCFDVDHDHHTGVVRGLLCRRCNTGLGYIEAGFHERALDYLRRAN